RMLAKILAPFLAALAVALVSGYPIIVFLRRLKAGQVVSTDAPQRHQAKSGTPTMGGLIILAGALAISLALAPRRPRLLAVVLLVVGMSNAVNLTDGLDGLAAGVTLPIWGALALLATPLFYPAGEHALAHGEWGIAAFCAAYAGATFGYLWFNAHPAQVFMGD